MRAAGLKRLVVGVVGVVAAIVGVAIAGHITSDSNGGLKPHGLQDTLPQTVASFGANARVVEIIVGSSGVYYQVIGADRQLHLRDYMIAESEIDAGTYGYNRKTRNFVRAPTAAESRSAMLTLGQLDPRAVDRLYSKVGFPRQGSSATLTGRSWFLESGAHPEHRFVAAYHGDTVQRTQAAAPPDPKTATIASSTQATTPTSSNASKATTTTVYSVTTTISSGSTKPGKLNGTTQRLVTCIAHAQGDVNKIAACQRKFVP
ncbi:MAG: hypothetical protein ACXVH1_07120 [Solirubrobacteraceae bacterium]